MGQLAAEAEVGVVLGEQEKFYSSGRRGDLVLAVELSSKLLR